MERGIFVTVCLLYYCVLPSVIFFWQAFIHWGFLAAGTGLCWKSNTVIHSSAFFFFHFLFTHRQPGPLEREFIFYCELIDIMSVEGGNTWCRAETETYGNMLELAEPSPSVLLWFLSIISKSCTRQLMWRNISSLPFEFFPPCSSWCCCCFLKNLSVPPSIWILQSCWTDTEMKTEN